jgi:hypothetical protein
LASVCRLRWLVQQPANRQITVRSPTSH